jgi:hypothetical protein
VLSPDEVVRDCVALPKHRAILTTCYTAGLRVSKAVHLRPPDIVDQGKGRRDRYMMLLAEAAPGVAGLVAPEPTHSLAVPGKRSGCPIGRAAASPRIPREPVDALRPALCTLAPAAARASCVSTQTPSPSVASPPNQACPSGC